MTLLNELVDAATDEASLDTYIQENFDTIYEFFTWTPDADLKRSLPVIKSFLTLKRRVILDLPITGNNLAFIALLLEVSERLTLTSPFRYLLNFLDGHFYEYPSRLKASAQFLVDVDDADTFLSRYEDIYNQLSSSLEEEEDNENKVLSTLVNYYLKAIFDFGPYNPGLSEAIRKKINQTLAADENSFLNRPLIWDILKTDTTSIDFSTAHIQELLDTFLDRGIAVAERSKEPLIEEGTIYSKKLERLNNQFSDIRQVSVREYQTCGTEAIRLSLQRGVQILDTECQLAAYMYSFGNMHFQKLMEAFSTLPEDIFSQHLNLLDWGCGQGMATMVLQEFLDENNIELDSAHAVLIEPSSIALSRAALHSKKYNSELKVITVNKDLDSVEPEDFKDIKGTIHLHLFSNILDIDFFSLPNLIKLIKRRFQGINYFVVVSPLLNDTKTARIDSFVKSFSRLTEFELLKEPVNQAKGEWPSGATWTRIERVFKVIID